MTNRWLGLPIVVVVMALVYYLAISVGTGRGHRLGQRRHLRRRLPVHGGAVHGYAVDGMGASRPTSKPTSPLLREDGIDVEGATAAPKLRRYPPLPTKARRTFQVRMLRRPAPSASSRTRRSANCRGGAIASSSPRRLEERLDASDGLVNLVDSPVWERSSATPSE